jgi:glycosyltransferase 2 family protein
MRAGRADPSLRVRVSAGFALVIFGDLMAVQADERGARPTPGFWHKHGVKLAVSVVIAAAFAWTLERGGLPLIPPSSAFQNVSVSSCVWYMVTLVFWHALRAARWRHLLAPIAEVPLRRVIAVSWIGFAAILLMPLRAGEFVRPYMIRQKGKVSIAAATGTVGAERIIDGLYLTMLLGLCMQLTRPLDPLPDHIGKLQIPVAMVPFYAYFALLGFLGAFALMALFYWRPRLGHKLVETTLGILSKRVAEKAADFVGRTADGLKFLPSLRYFGPFLFETSLYWLANGFGMWILARGCGIESISIVQAFVVMGVLGVGILVPAGPGLFGAFQASTYAALAMYFHDDVVLGPGVVFVFLLYVFQFSWHVLTAGFFLLIDRDAAREVIEAETA